MSKKFGERFNNKFAIFGQTSVAGNLNEWMYSLVELCSWDTPASELADRSDRHGTTRSASLSRLTNVAQSLRKCWENNF